MGGKTQGAEGSVAPERETDSTVLPITYHGMPSQWYDELIHTFFVKAVIDLTPLDGKFAWQCILNRVGYIGIAFTTEHESQLFNRLKAMYKLEMSKAGSALFNVQYAKAIGEHQETTTKPPPVVPNGSGRRRRKLPSLRRGAH